ncbi:alpha-amylase family glycosyl hydrolase [Fretibacter rubidus]|uniref:alpha-amylase family glycosyl hydrolase n=1 Tax=Fretibacter rubidus TaxID=570162 RepID=UPI003529EA46
MTVYSLMKLSLASVAGLSLLACSPSNPTSTAPSTDKLAVSNVLHPAWTKDAVIYQINTRQYSQEGTFAQVQADLPRIKDLGVDILWFMPIHPIGQEKRKGSMGSPYAVKDFQAVNPDLGTKADFKALVDAAHDLGLKVIIDWVANHTAWDNPLVQTHPHWYTRDADGNMQFPPDTDWADVVDLDYDQQGLRDYMIESLSYWVRDVGIDGFRCDVAGMVPTDFWDAARAELDAIKPVFMLAEWEEPELHINAFDATYAWRWKEIMQDIVNGKADATDIADYYAAQKTDWPQDAFRMTYTSNHDQNTWDGTPFEIYGDALPAAMVLSFVGEGMPLIYNGQEAGNDKRLEFFEKDLIHWNDDHPFQDKFRDLVALKTDNEVLHNGAWGARVTQVDNDNPQNVFSFIRQSDDGAKAVMGVFNLSDSAQTVRFNDDVPYGDYTTFQSGAAVTIEATSELSLEPWAYRVFVR